MKLDTDSLSDTKLNCKYYIIFVPTKPEALTIHV